MRRVLKFEFELRWCMVGVTLVMGFSIKLKKVKVW